MGQATCRPRKAGQGGGAVECPNNLLPRDHELGWVPLRGLRGETVTKSMSRRGFFQNASTGIYGAALTYLLGRDLGLRAAEGTGSTPFDLKPRPSHFAAKVKSVIHLFMN